MTTKFHREQYGRNGVYDDGVELRVMVNSLMVTQFLHDPNYQYPQYIVLELEQPGICRNPAGSIDIIAHEFGHGVSLSSLDIEPTENETKSLHESFPT